MLDGDCQTAAIVLAGGSGTRLGRSDGRNKVYLPLSGLPLVAWSLRTLDAHPLITRLVMVIRAGDEAEAAAAVSAAAVDHHVEIVLGGDTRSASERAGINAIRAEIADQKLQTVFIHDGARPFLDHPLIDRLLDGVSRAGASIPGLELEPGLIRHQDDELVLEPVTDLRRVQTPQAFGAIALVTAFDRAERDGMGGHDTAALVAWSGGPKALVIPGDPRNIKVTTTADLAWAEAYAANRL